MMRLPFVNNDDLNRHTASGSVSWLFELPMVRSEKATEFILLL